MILGTGTAIRGTTLRCERRKRFGRKAAADEEAGSHRRLRYDPDNLRKRTECHQVVDNRLEDRAAKHKEVRDEPDWLLERTSRKDVRALELLAHDAHGDGHPGPVQTTKQDEERENVLEEVHEERADLVAAHVLQRVESTHLLQEGCEEIEECKDSDRDVHPNREASRDQIGLVEYVRIGRSLGIAVTVEHDRVENVGHADVGHVSKRCAHNGSVRPHSTEHEPVERTNPGQQCHPEGDSAKSRPLEVHAGHSEAHRGRVLLDSCGDCTWRLEAPRVHSALCRNLGLGRRNGCSSNESERH